RPGSLAGSGGAQHVRLPAQTGPLRALSCCQDGAGSVLLPAKPDVADDMAKWALANAAALSDNLPALARLIEHPPRLVGAAGHGCHSSVAWRPPYDGRGRARADRSVRFLQCQPAREHEGAADGLPTRA